MVRGKLAVENDFLLRNVFILKAGRSLLGADPERQAMQICHDAEEDLSDRGIIMCHVCALTLLRVEILKAEQDQRVVWLEQKGYSSETLGMINKALKSVGLNPIPWFRPREWALNIRYGIFSESWQAYRWRTHMVNKIFLNHPWLVEAIKHTNPGVRIIAQGQP